MSEDLLDADFVADMRSLVDARPLHEDATLAMPGDEAARLVRLAEESLRLRAKLAAGAPAGPRGFLVKLDSQDGRGRMTALIEFNDEDELRRAGAWLAAVVVIAPAPPRDVAANEGGNRQSAIGNRETAL